MVYQPDDPEDGSAHEISLLTPKYHPIYESLRHGHPIPSSTSSTTSASEQVAPSRKPLSLHQQVVRPPTDAECGLPDLYTTTLSAIPSSQLPLSKHLSTPFSAVVLNGYTRSELAEGLAHALHLRRCNGGARAVLVVTNSEAAVREWMSALCNVLDEVQFISYSRTGTKRDATLVRLRDTQFPGVVVAAEKAAREGFTEMWAALRENRLVKNWEMVVSEAVTDTNVESVCSPLRMVREGTAENGVVLARKGLSRTKAVGVVRELDSLDADAFWLRKNDLPAVVEEREKRDESTSKRGRHSPEGKENRASLRNCDISDANKTETKPKQQSQGRKPSPLVTARKRSPVVPRARSTSSGDKRLTSGTESSTDLRRSTRIPARTASREESKADKVQREKAKTTGPIKRRQPWNRISPEILVHLPGPRRRTPQLSPPAASDEAPVAPRRKARLRQRSATPDSVKQPLVVPPSNGTKRASTRSRGSSSSSVVLSRTEMANEDEGNTTSSYRNKENVRKRARALGIYDTDSSEDTFYTPPSRPAPASSSGSSPDKFYTPRSSFSPKTVTDSTKTLRNSLLKIVSRKESSPRVREREPAKSAPRRVNSAPQKIGTKGKSRRQSLHRSDSSDDEPLSAKLDIRKAKDMRRSGKSRSQKCHESDSSDDEPLSTKLDARKARDRRRTRISLSPPRNGKKTVIQTTSDTRKREKTARRQSVFNGLLSPKPPPSQRSSGFSRRHSLAGPVRVKHESDLVCRERPPVIPNRRKSLPNIVKREDDLFNCDAPLAQGSSLPRTGSILPLKRRSLESGKARNTGDASRNTRIRSEARLPSRSPMRTSPVTRPALPDVIILISDSEEEKVRDTMPTKKRRLFANGESRRSTRRNNAEAGTAGRRIQGQNRSSSSNRPQDRSSRSLRDVHKSKEGNLGSFIRGPRNRKLDHLTEFQKKKYDKHAAEAKRCERTGRQREALESYEKCIEIYDGDEQLANRYLALSSQLGYLRPSDFSRRPTRSPIKKQSRRRRNSDRGAHGERNKTRIEVIDLTSS